MYISGNNNLTSLKGLENLTESGGGISITSNVSLTDITALGGISQLNFGPLDLWYNYALKDLTGLHNIEFIKKHLWIQWNLELETLEPLNDNLLIEDEDGNLLKIVENWKLAFCSEPAICNFLNNGGGYEIQNNSNGCQNADEIEAACIEGCADAQQIVFTGDENNDWDNPANWNLGRIPSSCDNVEIPEGKTVWLQGNVTIGSLLATSADIEGNEYSMTIQKGADLNNTNFRDFNTVTIQGVEEVRIVYCNIDGNFKIARARNAVSFIFSNVYGSNVSEGHVDITDDEKRINYIDIHGNYINGDLNLNINTTASDAWTKIAEDNDVEIRGSVNIKARNRGGEFRLGKLYQGYVNIRKNLTLDAAFTDYPMLAKINFVGDEPSEIIKAGSAEMEFEEIFFDKDWKELETTFADDITITDRANFNRGIAKPLNGKKLIFERNAFVSANTDESWVLGIVSKIGNTAFTFPVGSHMHKAPISVHPGGTVANDVAFDASYFATNPMGSGYDTAQREAGLIKVSGREYWKLEQTAGNTAITKQVRLSYDSMRSQKTNAIPDLRVAAWDGTEWRNQGVTEVTGNNAAATVKSTSIADDHTIFTLGYNPIRLPVVRVGNIPSNPCKGIAFKVPIDLDTIMVGGNTFQVHLSNADGNFNTFTIIGQKQNVTSSDTILATIPFGSTTGQNLLIRIVGVSPALTSINTLAITVAGNPLQPFMVLGPAKVCLNSGPAKYYIDTPEPGANFVWSILNGTGTVEAQQDTALVTWTTTGADRSIRVYSQNACGSGFEKILPNILVANPAPVAAPILANIGRYINASQPAPPQPGIGVKWYRNGSPIAAASGFSYYAGLSGNYTARYFNDCDDGPVSNIISFTNNALPQTITFETLPNKQFGDAAFSLQATASSGLPVTFSLVSGPGNLTAGVYTITGTGIVTIRTSQAGDDIYDTAAYVLRSFEVTKATQSIQFSLSPELLFPVTPFLLNGNTSSGLPLLYESNTASAMVSGGALYVNAPGTVSITARQPGNANYNPAAPVTQTACVRVTELSQISGAPFVCPGETTTYSINNINGLTYHWRLSNGTTYAATGSSVNITWNTPGTYTLIVSAQGNCGTPTANDSLQVEVINAITPGAPGNLLPVNNTNGLALPLLLSWTAGSNALTYDLYVWEEGTTKPATPLISNLTGFGYTLPLASLAYNKAYHWQVVSKNACLQTASAVQTVRLRPLPDLMVNQVNIPENANSGQTISINWTVKNVGPGNTTTNQSWTDAVFLSFDTFPNFTRPPQVQPRNWDQGEFPVRPLLVAARPNVTALNSDEQYSNSVEFTIPQNFSAKYYAYVITNFPAGQNAPQQMTVSNDTMQATNPLQVTPSPTPDLRVENVVVPVTTFSDSAISVNYRVKNYGVIIPLPAKWTDKIYISPSPLFNSNNAILLKQPKANGTYYPNARDASFDTSKQLAPDAFIDMQAEVVIPNFLQGTWFIHVHTNANESIYEGPLANNNINNTAIQLLLTPTPAFIVNNLNVPFSKVSTTQPLSISYNLFNSGFFDNAEKNKGHYYVPTLCAEGSGFRDSLGHGGSSWQDQVYISTNPNGLVTANARLIGTLYHRGNGLFSPDALYSTICPTGSRPSGFNTGNVLRPSSNHPQTHNFNMPGDLMPGTYYIYVYANQNKEVFVFPDTPVVSRSAPIVVNRPDLDISAITVSASAMGNQEITINYTVKNIGSGSVFSALRRDVLFVSNNPVFDASATYLKDNSLLTTMAPNAESNHSFTHTFPAGTNGMRYFHLIVNHDSTFRETNYVNNRKNPGVNIITATPADIIISNIQLADTLKAYKNNRISYTITNNGPATANGTWNDSIYISCSPTYSQSTAYFVQARQQTRNLPTGASVTDSFNLVTQAAYTYNACFGMNDETDIYVFVKTNANNGVFEGAFTNNNISGSESKRLNNTHVDHIVTQVSGAATTTVGRNYPVTWQVFNQGQMPTEGFASQRYFGWSDGIFFSPDSTFNSNAVLAGSKSVFTPLQNGQQYAEQLHVIVPKLPSGDYYVHARTDINVNISGELIKTNNTNVIRDGGGKARKIYVEQLPLPDLVSEVVNAPATTATAQPVKVNYRVKNEGAGDAFPASWIDNVWLSTDLIPNNGNDILLSSKTRSGGLNAGAAYLDSIIATIPQNVATGNYIIIVHTDAPNGVIEISENNNLSFSPIAIFTPASSDLIVNNVAHPDTAWLGYPIADVLWEVQNASAFAANGISTDGIYLSKTGNIDETAVLQGVLNKNVNLSPLVSQSFQLAPFASGVTEGLYSLLVRTDLLNNIPETDKTNNTGQSGKSIFIGVKPLVLNVPENNTLQNIERYYKMHIPDSLLGATILVTLKTPDSLSLKNELYAGAGYVPTAARFDHRFDIPNSGNQTLLIESAKATDYYIMVRSATPNPPVQNITLTAVKLPFAILTIQSNTGGNGGNVTVKINGSLFEQGMTARLSKTGTTIEASRIFFVNGGAVFATFPLQGKPPGIYTISLHKTDGSIAELANSFSVVAPGTGGLLTGGGINTGPNRPGNEAGCDPGADAGLNSQLVTELVYPAKVFNGQTFPVQVKFTNPTNMDIPAPTRVLFNDLQLKMNYTIGSIENGSNPFVLQLTETGGPPGIIRAGGSGSVTIYCRAPFLWGIAFVNFTIQ
jgi:subtilase family serine protease